LQQKGRGRHQAVDCHTHAQTATTLTLAEPVVATVLGVAALGEQLPALSWTGLAVLATGLAILAFPAGITRRCGPLLRSCLPRRRLRAHRARGPEAARRHA
jgi:hypothetical protein